MAWASRFILLEPFSRSWPLNLSWGLSTCPRYSRTTKRCTSCSVSWEREMVVVRIKAMGSAHPCQPPTSWYLCQWWGHMLKMMCKVHHFVHEGTKCVLCEPALGI
uniref:Uncharacterized protein n=1 Tax=Mus musculus TaxID=10090 RepID=Q3UMF2_MOUSE|nr:unnamed protein product [Mus musculus]